MPTVQEEAVSVGAGVAPPASWSWSLLELAAAPGGVAISRDGILAISVPSAHQVRLFGVDGGPLVLGGLPGWMDGPPGLSQFRSPRGVAFDKAGALYVADDHGVRRVSPGGEVTTLAGGTLGWADGAATEARFRHPGGVAAGEDGWVHVADTANNRVRRISPGGEVATLAGSIFDHGDGIGPRARFRWPAGIVAGPEGVVYVADTGNNRVCRIDRGGAVDTVAGAPIGGSADGRAESAGLRWPTGLALGPDGALYVADSGNSAVRRISPSGVVTTVARMPGWQPVAVASSPQGEVLVACTRWAREGPEGCLRWL